jgi:streptomycin 6-kinase
VCPFELPRNLLASLEWDFPQRDELRAWAETLPWVVAVTAERLALELGRPFQPGGMGSYVAPARTRSGERVVLKLGWQHDEALHEAEGLRAFDGAGAVCLHESYAEGTTSVLLMEICEPGTQLAVSLPSLEQDLVTAGLLRRLWIEPPPGHPFRPLEQLCQTWADRFEQHGEAQLESGVARAGVELFRSLSRAPARPVLLCTDLHPENILAAAREPWLAIDPKPYVGDPAYDPLQHMLNFPERLAADPAAFATRMAGLLDLDAERLRQWLFARCVVESPGWPELAPVALALARSVG